MISGGSKILLWLLSAERFFGRFRFFVFSGSEGGFVNAFSFVVPNVAFQVHPASLNVDLKLDLVIFREVSLVLEPSLVVFLKLRDEFICGDVVFANFVVLAVFPLDHLQFEVLLSQLVVTR